jgi:hypothetical protein
MPASHHSAWISCHARASETEFVYIWSCTMPELLQKYTRYLEAVLMGYFQWKNTLAVVISSSFLTGKRIGYSVKD